MQFPVEVKIEPSKSGSTFGIAFTKADKVLLVVKGCRLKDGANGKFVSGPATKMDDGKWLNYLFMDKAFGEYVTKLATESMSLAGEKTKEITRDDFGDDCPW